MNEEGLVEEAAVREFIVPAIPNPTLPEYPGEGLWKLKLINQDGNTRVCFAEIKKRIVDVQLSNTSRLTFSIGNDKEEEDESVFARAYRAISCILTTEDYHNKSSQEMKTIVKNAGHTLDAPDSGVLPCTADGCTEDRIKIPRSTGYRVVCQYHYMDRRVQKLLGDFNVPVDASRDAVYYHLMHGNGRILKDIIDAIMYYKFPNMSEVEYGTIISLSKNDDLPDEHELVDSYDEDLNRYLGEIFGGGTVFEHIAFKTESRHIICVLVPPRLKRFLGTNKNETQMTSLSFVRGTSEVERLFNMWWGAELNFATMGTGELDKGMLALELYLDEKIPDVGGVVTFDFPPTLSPFFGGENWKCEVRHTEAEIKFIFHPPPGFPNINSFNGLNSKNNKTVGKDGKSTGNYVIGFENLLKVQQQHYGKAGWLWDADLSDDELVTLDSIRSNDVLHNIPFQSASKDAANHRFVLCVKQRLEAYNAAKTVEEQGQVVNQVVKEWQEQTPTGRVVLLYDEDFEEGMYFGKSKINRY